MGFFSDLKEDLNQTVTELMPEESREGQFREEELNTEKEQDTPDVFGAGEAQGEDEPTEQQMVNLEEMLQNIDELRITDVEEEETEETYGEPSMGITVEAPEEGSSEEKNAAVQLSDFEVTFPEELESTEDSGNAKDENLEQELRAAFGVSGKEETMEEYLYKQAMCAGSEVIDKSWILDLKDMEATDENALVTAGMRVKGDILSNGNLDVVGEVIGNVQVSGKLSITGQIRGNSKADEIYADAAKITGDLIGDGTVKIGAGSVVRGNIEATSAAIAGAVKGTIDVKGPVVLDATAVVFGNIRAKSMQINNGARIEGMCVLCYAEQSASKFFETQENV